MIWYELKKKKPISGCFDGKKSDVEFWTEIAKP